MAPRLAQCSSRSSACAGQSMEMQRKSTSPSSRMTGLPQLGHVAGMRHTAASAGRSASTGPSTSGMTSPALRTMTVSPTRTSLRCTSSSL